MKARLRAFALSFLSVLSDAFILIGFGILLGLGMTIGSCIALSLSPKPAKASELSIPRAALPHRATLIRAAHAEMGLNAPVALLAAQIHTESRWRADAVSPVGARGLAQFMPATARWLPSVAPHTGEPLPFNPGWALKALCAYDRILLKQVEPGAASACDAWAFTLCAYNGGAKWVQRDRALAASRGLDPGRYWKNTETCNAGRKASAFKENREYPRRIFSIQSVYERAGWGPGVNIPAGSGP